MAYIVIAPIKVNGNVEDLGVFVSDDLDEAKTVAKSRRDSYTKKGYKAWANRVKLVSPKTPDAYIEFADKVLSYAKELDWNSNGNSFIGQDLFNWVNILKVRADELANPESYAD